MKIIFAFISFLYQLDTFENLNYELIEFKNDIYYNNIIEFNNVLYIGTNQGIFKLDENNNYLLINNKIKGGIEIVNGEFKNGEVIFNAKFDELLPKGYDLYPINSLKSKEKLYIISKGDLFVFKQSIFNYFPIGSIRTISENYIGSYNGIYNKKENLFIGHPTYANSYIREYGHLTFICWDGLTIIDGDNQIEYSDSGGKGVVINSEIIGLARDILPLDHPRYLLFTTDGIYVIDIEKNTSKKIKESKEGLLVLIRSESNVYQTERIYYHDSKNIYEYNVVSGKERIILKDVNPEIVFSNSSSVYYVFSNQKLLYFHLDFPEKSKVLVDGLTEIHSIGKFEDFIYLTGNIGLSLYNISKSHFIPNLIKTEFNKNAHIILDQKLQLGSIGGLHVFNYQDLLNLFESIKEPSFKKENDTTYILYGIILVFGVLAVITIIWQWSIINKKLNQNKFIPFEEQVNYYIRKNLANVTIEELCENFKISRVKLYTLLNNAKPGDIIREERLKAVRKMRKNGNSEEEISITTGFSISYLKKI